MSDSEQKAQKKQSEESESTINPVELYDAWEYRFRDKSEYTHDA